MYLFILSAQSSSAKKALVQVVQSKTVAAADLLTILMNQMRKFSRDDRLSPSLLATLLVLLSENTLDSCDPTFAANFCANIVSVVKAEVHRCSNVPKLETATQVYPEFFKKKYMN